MTLFYLINHNIKLLFNMDSEIFLDEAGEEVVSSEGEVLQVGLGDNTGGDVSMRICGSLSEIGSSVFLDVNSGLFLLKTLPTILRWWRCLLYRSQLGPIHLEHRSWCWS